MSSQRIPETQRAEVVRLAPARLTEFFAEAGALTRRGDAPLLPEWTDWAARYETLEEVWHASQNPEFLIFMLGHAVRRNYVESPVTLVEALERYVTWCVDAAGLDPREFRSSDWTLVDTSPDWFSHAGMSPFSRARRATRAAERAATGGSRKALAREMLRQRAEQAGVLRLLVDNPFEGCLQIADSQPLEDDGETGCDLPEPEESGYDPMEDEPSPQSELLLAPAQRGSWGVVTRLAGPPDPAGSPETAAAALRQADGCLRHGMILLAKKSIEDCVIVAEDCFRDGLSRLLADVGEMHPKVAYACDRIGLVCQLQGREEEAEAMYLRAIALVGRGDVPEPGDSLR
jgi:hypothetical protein